MGTEVGVSFQAFRRTLMLRARPFTLCTCRETWRLTTPVTRRVCNGCYEINSLMDHGLRQHEPFRCSRTRSRASRTDGINSSRTPDRAGRPWHYSLRSQTTLNRPIDLSVDAARPSRCWRGLMPPPPVPRARSVLGTSPFETLIATIRSSRMSRALYTSAHATRAMGATIS